MAGDFILAVASMMIARLQNDDVTLVLSQVSYSVIDTNFCRLKTILSFHVSPFKPIDIVPK